MTPPAVSLLIGRTVHVRETPFRRAFSHAIAMIEIDIDRLDEAAAAARLFSVNRSNAIAFRDTDNGARDSATSLRAWAEARFAEAGVMLAGGSIRLITFPRVLGHGFAPISLWLGHGPGGELRGVVYEVHNTFGETHAYVSALGDNPRAAADKEFFVSPFFGVDGQYRFTFRNSPARLELIVENVSADGRSHVASLLARRSAMTDAAIARWLVAMPFSGLGVVLAIHWQALALLIRGARYRHKPPQRLVRTTLAEPDLRLADATEQPRKRA
jgi:DUF1365 family protein